MSAVAPRLRPARVTVTLKDGRKDTQSCESHRGDFLQPFTDAEMRDKFRDLASEVLTPEGAREVERAVDRCEEWNGARELVELMRRHSRR